MKKYSWVLCFALMLFAFTAHHSASAASTGEVQVTGSVPVMCDLNVQQQAGATGIADISAGHADRHIATVTETCNSPDGYTVTLSAFNSADHTGMFVDTVSGDSHPFTITYNGRAVTPGGIVTDSVSPVPLGVQKQVHITYPADETLTGAVGDTYEETLTFTISAK